MHYKKLLVDVETLLKKQLEELRITNYLYLDKITHTRKVPKKNYWIYDVESGEEMLGKSPEECLKIFSKQKRIAGNLYEALALFREDPKILEKHFIDIAGSRYGRDFVPYLGLYDDGPGLDADYADFACSGCGSFSFGSKKPLNLEDLTLA